MKRYAQKRARLAEKARAFQEELNGLVEYCRGEWANSANESEWADWHEQEAEVSRLACMAGEIAEALETEC